MGYIFENIQFNSDIPINIFVHNLNYVQNHWHDALEILFVLDGNVHIGIGKHVYELDKEDLIVINPNEIHTTSSTGTNLVLALQISSRWMDKYPAFKDIRLSCNSRSADNQQPMDQIRKLLAQMMWIYNNQSSCFEMKLQSHLFELLYQLFTYFREGETKISSSDSEKYMPRLSNIINYLHKNYGRDLSLQELAEKEFLSVSYLSRFFKHHIGTSYKDYMVRLKLEHAVKDLLYTDKSIVQLSFDNGFPNTNSFLEAFKASYHEAPSVYRKRAKKDYQFLFGPQKQSSNYFEIENFDMFTSLYKYLNWDVPSNLQDSSASITLGMEQIDMTGITSPHSKEWKNLMTIGKAKDVLNPVIKEQLLMTQREIGFHYIRFHGIFDDEMSVYTEDSDGNPILDFTTIDSVIDTLYALELRPFVELSFMPGKLARSHNPIFLRPSIISMPKDMGKWCFLIEGFLRHCMERYGTGEVENWLFEFWNEPDITGLFWNDSLEDYLAFYHRTYRTIKNISPKLRLGGPAVCNLAHMESWLSDFFAYCSFNHCLPDFFTFHFYLHSGNLNEIQSSFSSGFKRITLSTDPDFLKGTIRDIHRFISPYGYDRTNIFMTEWNSSPSHRDLSRDTLFMASYIVKNILENVDSVNSFGYWTISDFIEEFPIPSECFHGGLGVVTVNGIKKAGFYAFQFLNLLGDRKIASGPGYYITAGRLGYQILLYNYCHFDPLYCSIDHSSISYKSRYDIFKDNFKKTIQLSLKGLEKASYSITEYTVNRSHGSSFDTWVDMGAPENMSKVQLEYLKSKSIPHYHWEEAVIDDCYVLNRCLTPHEIRFIEILPKA